MKLFENGVGRPTNEIKRKRKIFKIGIITGCLVILISILLVISQLNMENLSGANIFSRFISRFFRTSTYSNKKDTCKFPYSIDICGGIKNETVKKSQEMLKKLGYYNGEMLYEYYVFFTPLTTENTYLKLVNTIQQAGECMPYTLYGITIENVASATDNRKALTSVEESVVTSDLGFVSNFSTERFVINDSRATHVKTNGVTVNGYNLSEKTDSTWLLKLDFGTGGGILPLNQFDTAIKENMAAGADVAYTWTISCYTTLNASEFYLLQCISSGGQSPTPSKWAGNTGVKAYYVHQDENDNGKM